MVSESLVLWIAFHHLDLVYFVPTAAVDDIVRAQYQQPLIPSSCLPPPLGRHFLPVLCTVDGALAAGADDPAPLMTAVGAGALSTTGDGTRSEVPVLAAGTADARVGTEDGGRRRRFRCK